MQKNSLTISEAIVKQITLLALCMLVLGSGAAMADGWIVPITISESTAFDKVTVTNPTGADWYLITVDLGPPWGIISYPNPFGWFSPLDPGYNGQSWGPGGGYLSATGGNVYNLQIGFNFAGNPSPGQHLEFNLYDSKGGTPVGFHVIDYDVPAPAPEPSLVLLLGIGLGAVGLIVWRRVV